MATGVPEGAPPGGVLARLTRKTSVLFTLFGSIAPLNGIEIRGWTLKPSSALMTSASAKSSGLVAGFGKGRLTVSAVFWLEFATVKRSLGKGACAGSLTLKSAWMLAAKAKDG